MIKITWYTNIKSLRENNFENNTDPIGFINKMKNSKIKFRKGKKIVGGILKEY